MDGNKLLDLLIPQRKHERIMNEMKTKQEALRAFNALKDEDKIKTILNWLSRNGYDIEANHTFEKVNSKPGAYSKNMKVNGIDIQVYGFKSSPVYGFYFYTKSGKKMLVVVDHWANMFIGYHEYPDSTTNCIIDMSSIGSAKAAALESYTIIEPATEGFFSKIMGIDKKKAQLAQQNTAKRSAALEEVKQKYHIDFNAVDDRQKKVFYKKIANEVIMTAKSAFQKIKNDRQVLDRFREAVIGEYGENNDTLKYVNSGIFSFNTDLSDFDYQYDNDHNISISIGLMDTVRGIYTAGISSGYTFEYVEKPVLEILKEKYKLLVDAGIMEVTMDGDWDDIGVDVHLKVL